MNNFHRSFQNFRQFSNLFSQIWLKKRHTSLFPGICREIRTKFYKKFAENMQNSTQKMKKIGNSFFIREKMLTIFGWNFEIEERCKGVHCVDLGESFPTILIPTSIYLQKSASIQPRTSPSKFGGKFNSLFICLLSGDPQRHRALELLRHPEQLLAPELHGRRLAAEIVR